MRKRLTPTERAEVYAKCGGHCAYCGAEIPIGAMQVDHVRPLALGGADEMDNYFPACRSCNHYKSTMGLNGFRDSVERWPEVLARDSVTYKNAVRFGMVVPMDKKVVFYFEAMEGVI